MLDPESTETRGFIRVEEISAARVARKLLRCGAYAVLDFNLLLELANRGRLCKIRHPPGAGGVPDAHDHSSTPTTFSVLLFSSARKELVTTDVTHLPSTHVRVTVTFVIKREYLLSGRATSNARYKHKAG